VGLSWGSSLALALYGRRPDLPRSLILAAAYAGWAGSLPREEVERRLDVALREMDRPAEECARSWIPPLLTHRATPEMADELVAIIRDFRPSGARPMLYAMAEADLRPVLPTIRVPTLLLYGEEDVRSPTGGRGDAPGDRGIEARIPARSRPPVDIEAAGRFDAEVRRSSVQWVDHPDGVSAPTIDDEAVLSCGEENSDRAKLCQDDASAMPEKPTTAR
jgi:pimeloyl-ACP methyl ester carboxylesterase